MVNIERLAELGVDAASAAQLLGAVDLWFKQFGAVECWRRFTRSPDSCRLPFEVHNYVHEQVFADWDAHCGPAPGWVADQETIEASNISELVEHLDLADYESLHCWSVTDRQAFWQLVIERLGIRFQRPADAGKVLAEGSIDVEEPQWLPGARLNIVESCFGDDDAAAAIVYGDESGTIEQMSCRHLRAMTNRVSNSLVGAGFCPGDAIAIDMPMSAPTVAIYLGIVQAGCVVVGIADSFAAPQIAERMKIAGAKGVFTCGFVEHGGKRLAMYEKIVAADAPRAIVLGNQGKVKLRDGDQWWNRFLSDDEAFDAQACDPHDVMNILFSSGTTAEPKAIPWDHTTPIRCATDGRYHHDIHPGDVIAWPTSLGWMMGPWLIFAALMNRATIALYDGAATEGRFGRFVQDAQVNVLGLVPSLVRRWRQTGCMEQYDWSRIRAFSSTGECSNRQDMLYLMYLAGYRPIIEYCGGTEIGGGYITGTVVQPNAPSTFSTPALGIDLVILDDAGNEADEGELFLIGPSIGLSRRLLNRDHHEVYFEGTPLGPGGVKLRRHGDQFQRLAGGGYRALGRADDTMNLGGIKVSSAQIERALAGIESVKETAAIAVSPADGGPAQLVIYAVLSQGSNASGDQLRPVMQQAIRERLNPLFKVADVVVIDALPRTASQKVMRRELRRQYAAAGQ